MSSAVKDQRNGAGPTMSTNAQYHSFVAKEMNADLPQTDLSQIAAGIVKVVK
jgi:major membrane immunogen (membrane-anchored lipoprotein)